MYHFKQLLVDKEKSCSFYVRTWGGFLIFVISSLCMNLLFLVLISEMHHFQISSLATENKIIVCKLILYYEVRNHTHMLGSQALDFEALCLAHLPDWWD